MAFGSIIFAAVSIETAATLYKLKYETKSIRTLADLIFIIIRVMKKTLLWLDDCRNPFDKRVDWLAYSPIGRDVEVIWIQSVDEFFNYIDNHGLPDGICFDHDLGEDSYDDRTGYDCAMYLIEYCMQHEQDIPAYNVQSSNPVGKENIKSLLDNYHNYYLKYYV